MSRACLHLHVPVRYILKGGVLFDATRIEVTSCTICVRGYTQTWDGPESKTLVIVTDTPVDIEQDIRDTVAARVLAGQYEIT